MLKHLQAHPQKGMSQRGQGKGAEEAQLLSRRTRPQIKKGSMDAHIVGYKVVKGNHDMSAATPSNMLSGYTPTGSSKEGCTAHKGVAQVNQTQAGKRVNLVGTNSGSRRRTPGDNSSASAEDVPGESAEQLLRRTRAQGGRKRRKKK